MVETSSLLNCHTLIGIVGSNPTPSAKLFLKFFLTNLEGILYTYLCMDGATFCAISLVLLVLVYVPGLVPFIYYVHSRGKCSYKRNHNKEEICLIISSITMLMALINIALLCVFG